MERNDIIDAILKELHSVRPEPRIVYKWAEDNLVDADETIIDGIVEELIEKGVVQFGHNRHSVSLSLKVAHLVRDYHSYKLYVQEMERQKQPRITNIQAEQVAYVEGDNYGSQSFSGKATIENAPHKNQPTQNENKSNLIVFISKMWWLFIIPLSVIIIGLAIENDWFRIMD